MSITNPELRLHQVETDLPYLHKQRWSRIAAELQDRRDAASDGDQRAQAEAKLATHYETRFHSETSRAALLAEAQAEDERPAANGQ